MSKITKKNKQPLVIVFQILLVMYVVQIANVVTHGSVKFYGIHPRDPGSLWFVVTAPFIHNDWIHLVNNTLCFAVFSSLCLMRGTSYYIKSSLFIILLGGLMVWAMGRPAVHIGASGWIFGLWSLIIATAWYERSLLNILISLGVIVFYGGMIFGILPTEDRISYESHLFGAIAGVAAASLFSYKKRAQT